jgi:hypothetical protein
MARQRRRAQAEALIHRYLQLKNRRANRRLLYLTARSQQLAVLRQQHIEARHRWSSNRNSYSSLSSLSGIDSDSDSIESSDSHQSWSSLLGANWRDFADSDSGSSDGTSLGFSLDLDSMPDLDSLSGSESDSNSDSDSERGEDSGDDADDEDMTGDEAAQDTSNVGIYVRQGITGMYSHRYEQPREPMPRPPPKLPHILHVFKHERPDRFREELRVSPTTFDNLLKKISDDPVFMNNSPNAQTPIETQLGIVLWRFGHSGNAASQQQVADFGDVGKGTVTLITRRVLTALLRPSFINEAVRMPTQAEKDDAKAWVRTHSCKAWRNGWCLVDGTLIPLYDRPHWYGESYFDRKCNYSLNLQVRKDN